MKKKMVKLLSIVMLLSMMFSMTVSGAYALVDDGSNSGSVIIGGTITSGTNVGGNLVIGATERPADDSPYDGPVASTFQKEYTTAISEAAQANRDAAEAAIEAATQDAAKKYAGREDGDYTGIVDSELPMVQANQDFLKYIRDNLDTVDKATLQTAIDLFGEDAVYGKAEEKVDTNTAQQDLYAVLERMAEIEDVYVAEHPEDPFCDELLADETSEYYQLYIQGEALSRLVANPGIALMSLVPSGNMTSHWPSVCSEGGSLAEATARGGELYFKGPSFDICNSTDYRITIDLHGSTIQAQACDAAFTIRGKTITFTNGTINGDGFYVCDNGVLNLGGLINTRLVDITVNALRNAIYVDSTGTCVIAEGATINGFHPNSNPVGEPILSNDPAVFINTNGVVRMTGGTVNGGKAASVYSWNGTFEMMSSVAEVNNNNGYVAIVGEGDSGSKISVHAGTVYGATGIAVKGTGTVLSMNGGKVTGYLKPATSVYPNTGAAITVYGDSKDGGTSPFVYVNGGTLRSEYNAGVINDTDGAGTRPANKSDIKRITVDDINVSIQEAHGYESDYAKVTFIIKDENNNYLGYQTLADAIDKINTISSGKTTISMIADYKMTAADSAKIITSSADQVTFDGNGHTLVADFGDGVTSSAKNLILQNITIHGKHSGSGIAITGGGAYIGDNVYVDHFENGLLVSSGDVKVNGLDVDDDTDTGIKCTGGKTTVIMCKIDAVDPVNSAATSNLII